MKSLNLWVGVTFAAVAAHAAVINPGGAVVPNGIVTAVGTSSAILLTESGNYQFSAIPPDISGSYVETAYADTTNPFNSVPGVHDTTLVLQLTAGGGTATIERATLGYFGDVKISVSYVTSSSVAPIGATLSAQGTVIGFTFTGLTPGQVETLVVYTCGTGAEPGGALSIQDGTAGDAPGISVIPEPAETGTLSGAFAMCGAWWLGRKRQTARRG